MINNEKLYFNGDIITLEDEQYVEAVLINGSRITKVGTKEELLKLASKQVELIDLQGKTMIPSFIDPHSHFSGYASSFMQVDLVEATNFEEIGQAIKKFIEKNNLPAGKWIQATGYDQNYLEEKKHPTKQLLDQVSPHHPLIVKHKSGHMGVLNSLGIQALGINEDTMSPEGGLIEKRDGEVTGYLEENAFIKYIQELPIPSNEEFMECLLKAQDSYLSHGITTAQEGFVMDLLAGILQYLTQTKMLKLDLIGYIDMNDAENLKAKFNHCLGQYDNHFKIGGYKTFLDGSPQGRTAWMRTPYQGGEPNYYAYGTQKDEEIYQKLVNAIQDNMQILVHCNGDKACEQYLSQYQLALEKTQSTNQIRPVIIHAQLLAEDQLDTVKALNMIPSFFIGHVYHWGDIHIKNFGIERASKISLLKSAQDKGIRYTLHTDAPVIEPNMIEAIWCATNRITKAGVILGEDERVSPLEALEAVTINAAYQYFEEDIKGTIKEGKLADFVILDKNILKVDKSEIKNIQVLETIKEGQTLYKKHM